MYVNTLALSKVWFVANVFPIDRNTALKISKETSVYLWQNNFAEPIKRDILNLPVKAGGLGILDTSKQCMALRTKHLLRLNENDKPHESLFLQKYFLALSLTALAKNTYPQWSFLAQNNFPKSLKEHPFFYKDVLEKIRKKPAILQINQKITKSVYLFSANHNQNENIAKAQRKWDAAFQKILSWNNIWRRNFNSYAQGPCQNVQWRILHDILPIKQKIHSWKKNRGRGLPNCDNCNNIETTLYPFINCKMARTVWRHFKSIYE